MLAPLFFIAVLSPLAQCGPMTGHRHEPVPAQAPHVHSPHLNARCPVMGDPVTNDSPLIMVGNKSYAVCCPSCGTKLKAAPEKYLHEDGTPRNAQGTPADPSGADHAGHAGFSAQGEDHSAHQH